MNTRIYNNRRRAIEYGGAVNNGDGMNNLRPVHEI